MHDPKIGNYSIHGWSGTGLSTMFPALHRVLRISRLVDLGEIAQAGCLFHQAPRLALMLTRIVGVFGDVG